MSFSLSKATIQDASELNDLVNSAYRGDSSRQGWTTEADLLDGTRVTTELMAEILAKPETTILKYVDGNKIQGCVELRNTSGKLYLGMLTVAPSLQGKGIGKVMLQAAEVEAKRLNCEAIFMTVISIRKELIDWYKRHGYLETGERKPFHMPDTRWGVPKQVLEFIVLQKVIAYPEASGRGTAKFIPFLALLVLALFSASTIEQTLTHEPKLFVFTGFGSSRTSITKDELTKLYHEGKVYVSIKAQSAADKIFQSTGKKISIREFSRIAKNKFIVLTDDEMVSQLRNVAVDGVSFDDFDKPYPLSQTSFSKDSVTKLSITGVTALTRSIGILMNEKGYAVITEKLKPAFKASDLVHISNEVSLTDSCVFSHRGRVFCSKAEHFKALLDLGCNVVELTGNHNKDFGEQSFIKTLKWYHANGMQTFGGGLNDQDANKPLVLTLKDGTRLGFIGFNELCPINECAKPKVAGANQWNREKARMVIQKMKNEMKLDVVIASVQFGEWDFYHPQKSQRRIAYDLIDFGADLVYGAHAHQIQQVEFYKSKPIFYGLGNFLFDEIQRIGVRQGMFINIYITKGKIIQANPVYTFMGDNRVNGLADSLQAAVTKKSILVDSLLYR